MSILRATTPPPLPKQLLILSSSVQVLSPTSPKIVLHGPDLALPWFNMNSTAASATSLHAFHPKHFFGLLKLSKQQKQLAALERRSARKNSMLMLYSREEIGSSIHRMIATGFLFLIELVVLHLYIALYVLLV